jgi:hypothetical protein
VEERDGFLGNHVGINLFDLNQNPDEADTNKQKDDNTQASGVLP